MMPAVHETIRRDLQTLREAGKSIGATARKYMLNEPLSMARIMAFESKHQIQLPEGYREFLLFAGNGGVGPGYGVEQLGQAYDVDWSESPGLVGDLAEPFPYTEPWNERSIDASLPIEDHYRQQDEYWSSCRVPGAMPICHFGCNLRLCLIVTGVERGNLWFDDRADWQGLYPHAHNGQHRITFLDWYRQWLDVSLLQLQRGS